MAIEKKIKDKYVGGVLFVLSVFFLGFLVGIFPDSFMKVMYSYIIPPYIGVSLISLAWITKRENSTDSVLGGLLILTFLFNLMGIPSFPRCFMSGNSTSCDIQNFFLNFLPIGLSVYGVLSLLIAWRLLTRKKG